MQNPNPTVSFVIPCYKLAHFLEECINSILSQSFHDFEVLIMDDCSPDNTGEIAQTFQDRRVRYIRNHQNLGHLSNYNKGIKLSHGKYVWLISADDRLRSCYVLQRYVQLMESNPNVGYVCCPGIGFQDGKETTLAPQWGYFGSSNKIFNGRDFISASLKRGYGLLAPSVMVRKCCYDEISDFPLDMPHQGDKYLWLRWALDYDVAYMYEPMVNYRLHDLNIFKELIRQEGAILKDEVAVFRRLKHHCEDKGFINLAKRCIKAVSLKYARAAVSAIYGGDSYYRNCGMSIEQCDTAMYDCASSELEYRQMRGFFLAAIANSHWRHGDFGDARRYYDIALQNNWKMPQIWLKTLLLRAGLGPIILFIKDAQVTKRLSEWSDSPDKRH